MDADLARLRVDYGRSPLRSAAAGTDPMALFAEWFDAARDASPDWEPNAMTLATAAPDGTPSARMVLLKGVDHTQASFTWFTNLNSRKAQEATGARAALCWWWPQPLARQVRAVGRVELIDRSEVDTYFASRPAAARIGAAASRQSRPIASRSMLADVAASIAAESQVAPDDWGGLRLQADELEFWQGQEARLHDRITFLRLSEDGSTIRSKAAAAAAGGADALLAAGTLVVDPHGAQWLRVRLQP